MPTERFLFLEKTLQEIDELTPEFHKSAGDLEDSKNHLNEIKSDIESTKSKLLHESEVCHEFDAKKKKLENEILLEIEKFEQANNSMREHADSKLSGLSAKKFRKEKLHKKVDKIRKKSDENIVLMAMFALLFGVGLGFLGFAVWESINPHPNFICTASKQEISHYDVLDGVEDCPDGSDEESSGWDGSGLTRADAFTNADWWDAGQWVFCSGFFFGGLFLPHGIIHLRGDKVILVEREFDRKHKSDLRIAERLEGKARNQKSAVDRKKEELRRLEKSKLNLLNLRTKLKSLEGYYLDNANEEILIKQKIHDDLGKEIDGKWEAISDMVPYGNKIL